MADQLGSGRPTPKVPYPRQLTKKETLDSLSHWQTSVRNYFRRFPEYSNFFKRSSKWVQSSNYGFTGEDKLEQVDNLEALLDTLATFLPGPYLTHQITKTTTCMQDVWDIIWDHYGVKPSSSSFLDYDSIKLEKDERYIDLYDRLVYHTINHLCGAGTNGGPQAGGTLDTPDQFTLSHRNHVALDWLRKIDPNLIKLVKLEYSKDLKAGVPIASLVKSIADNIDSLLHRSSQSYSTTSQISSDCAPFNDVSVSEQPSPVCRVSSLPYRPRQPPTNFRGSQFRQNNFRNTFSQSNSRPPIPRSPFPPVQSKPFCQPCYSIGKKLNLNVNYSHAHHSCPQNASVRNVQSEMDDQPQATELSEQGELQNLSTDCVPTINQFQIPEQIIRSNLETQMTSTSTWMDQINLQVRNIESRLSSSVRKEKSPSLHMTLNSVSVYPTIDEGSEINVIDHEFLKTCNIPFSRTVHQATAAGSHSMSVMGETKEDIILHKTFKKHFIRWNLKKCIVVRNLGCPILVGEPGKKDNFISTVPSQRVISTLDIYDAPVSLPYEIKPILFSRNFICRATTDMIMFPGDKIKVDLPSMLHNEHQLLFTPRVLPQADRSSLPSQTCTPNNHQVQLSNLTDFPLSITKNQHYGDITPLTAPHPVHPKHTHVASTYVITPTESQISKATIDPDNILSNDWKQHFYRILERYSNIITSIPGCYNGFYGNVDCSLNFIQPPPASNKARLPSYSHDKLVEMANIMDEMESWGVLKKPHDLGITVKNVHTSYLVPKSDGSHRFVTDFTSLLPFIGKLEIISPTISQAKRMLSSFKYFIELDLSHCFWQGQMSVEDSSYLATPHPFGGIRCYAREPQGIRNASEHNSERLSIVFGDLEKDKKMTRMADGLYIGGDTLETLSDNFVEVLSRAEKCGLTFKPSKVVICPISTILFGWKKNGDQWSPTSHVMTPLSSSQPPKTVKQLRGWIGAYRQLSETIKDHAITLTLLEKETAGRKSRDEIKWTPPLLASFNTAKESLKHSQSVTIPKPSDILHIYPDTSQSANAVGGHLVIERMEDGSVHRKNGGFFSVRLDQSQSRWTPCEKEALGIKLNIEHFKPFIQESYNTTIIHPDNMISVHAWNRLKKGIISTSSKVAAFLSSLSENNIDLKHCPGVDTKVADYGSRNPQPCSEKRCQICKFMSEQCQIGESCVNKTTVNSVSVSDILSGSARLPLIEKPAWLQIQKDDDTHNRLYKLITSGGLQPERKLRGHTNLKLMYNMYMKGLLRVDHNGLIIVKHIDTSSGIEYDAISVPKQLYPSIIQSLHIKLEHPSRNQMHRFAHRYFHCVGSTQTIDDIHKSCQVCTSLSTLPKTLSTFSTEKIETLGSHFSADVLVSDNQKIFLCREKLTQFTFSRIIPDESAETLRSVILDSVLDIMPPSGTTVRVDAAPGLQSINKAYDDIQTDDVLKKHSIKLEIGRTINPNKNPIAENAIKEFR